MGREPRGKGGGGALWKFRFGLVPSHKQDPIQNSGSCSWIMKARVGGKICVLQVNIFKLCHINSKNVLLSCLPITVDFFFISLLSLPLFHRRCQIQHSNFVCVCFGTKESPLFLTGDGSEQQKRRGKGGRNGQGGVEDGGPSSPSCTRTVQPPLCWLTSGWGGKGLAAGPCHTVRTWTSPFA